MKKTDKQYVLILILFAIVSLLSIIIFYKSFAVTKENFLPKGLHNCYPYSSQHNAANSYKTLGKGWCTTGEYGPIPDHDDFSAYNPSPVKCPPNYSRVRANESVKHRSKAWCKKPNN